jgi:ubiquinone/menaquinone biosynthesis C-methylase UbiE
MSDKSPGSGAAAAEAWSRYWASGPLHSCPNAFAGNYDDEIRDFWMSFFGSLPDGASILDIGTGNGAVAFLARDAADALKRRFHIEGIDAAVIHPAAAAARHGIEAGDIVFRGNTSCERTGYPDGHFDAASSQYAIEYSRIDDSLKELARVLKPGGVAGFVIHHAGSEALVTTLAELKAFDYLRREAPLVVASRRLLRRLSGAGSAAELEARMNDRDTQEQQKEIRKLLQRVSAYGRSRPHAGFLEGIATQVAATLQQTRAIGTGAALDRLAVLEGEMTAHRERLRAMVQAGKSRDDIGEFCALAVAAGFAVDAPHELRRGGRDLLGWVVGARRLSNEP